LGYDTRTKKSSHLHHMASATNSDQPKKPSYDLQIIIHTFKEEGCNVLNNPFLPPQLLFEKCLRDQETQQHVLHFRPIVRTVFNNCHIVDAMAE
jgi:hypothetical protein